VNFLSGVNLANLITAAATAIGSVLAVLTYLSGRDRRIAVQTAFRSVVDSLSSTVEGQRLGAAILIRRFFDVREAV
jgi:hypothetical protein